MALTRSVPRVGGPPTTRTAFDTAEPAADAARLEALLGDPRDPGNPYGRSALWAAGHDALPAPPAGLPGAKEPQMDADRVARALRPLFRRDLALAHAWSIRPLLCAPVPHPAAVLLGPAALTAVAAGVLGSTARIVDGLGRHEPGVRQWQPVLASAFADLLACESLTAVALRSGSRQAPVAGRTGPSPQPERELAAVVGYLVPQLVGEMLGDLELVLAECGFDRDTPERRTLARIIQERAFAGVDWTAAGVAQAGIVRGLREAAGSRAGGGTECAALFRITEPAPVMAPGTDCVQAVTATLAAATARLAGAVDPDTAALARVGRRLVGELRTLTTACTATALHHPADPAARALADRQALLVLAGAALGVREAAAGARLPFLGGAGWALLALGRITGRLGLPLPDRTPDPQPGVWAELARRGAHGLDCDLYATRARW